MGTFYAVGTSKCLVKKMFIFTTITYVWLGFKDVSRSKHLAATVNEV